MRPWRVAAAHALAMRYDMTQRIYLRSLVHRLTVTAISTADSLPPVVVICPWIAWAMELKELERVAVFNVKTRGRLRASVLFGSKRQLEVSPVFRPWVQVGDEVMVSSCVAVPPGDSAARTTTIVWAKGNRPLEIRRVSARRISRDQGYAPLLPRPETVVPA